MKTENVGRYRSSNQLKTAKKSMAKQILGRTDDKQKQLIKNVLQLKQRKIGHKEGRSVGKEKTLLLILA